MDLTTTILASSVCANALAFLQLSKANKGDRTLKRLSSDMNKLAQLVGISQESAEYIQQLELSTLLFNQSEDSILVADPNGVITSANPSYYKKTGYTANEVVGSQLGVGIRVAEHCIGTYIELAITSGVSSVEGLTERADSTIFPELYTITPIIKDGQIKSLVMFARDISVQKEREGKLIREVKRDTLTGVFNRSGFDGQLASAIKGLDALGESTDYQVGLVFLDLDEFKPVNDTYGHDIGDRLLIAVADRLNDCVGEVDTVARLGGDEFVCIFPLCKNKDDLKEKAQTILDAMRTPVETDVVNLTIKCSIGAACYPSDADTQELLLKASDVAMYQAKMAGKNQIRVYDAEFKTMEQELEELSVALEKAAAENLLSLAFRPVYSDGGDVFYFDVLLRWFHEGEEIPPFKFVKVAEMYGLMQQLYDFTLRQMAFSPVVKRMLASGAQFSIKFEEKAVKNDQFAQSLVDHLASLSIPKEQIIVRVDEQVVAANYKASLSNINYLEESGVKVCLDDFCVGDFSILNRIALKSSFAKLPRELVKEMTSDRNKVHVLASIFALASAMDTVIVIEGVESREAYKLFGEYGAQFMQGDYLSEVILEKHMPLDISELSLDGAFS